LVLRKFIGLLVVTVVVAIVAPATSAAPALVTNYGTDDQRCAGALLGGRYEGRGTRVFNGNYVVTHCSATLVEGVPVERTFHFSELTPTGGCEVVMTPAGRMNYTCRDIVQ
jgi:hypothetical protein